MEALEDDGITIEQFLEWAATQEGRFELVDGQIQMMAGATNNHNDVKNNVEYALTTLSRPKGCRTHSSDSGVSTGERGYRLPDIVVNCGPRDPNAKVNGAPTIVVEISSQGTRSVDLGVKLAEYQALSSIRVIIQIEPDEVALAVHRRVDDGWQTSFFDQFDAVVPLPELDGEISVRDVYLDMNVVPRPKLQIVPASTFTR